MPVRPLETLLPFSALAAAPRTLLDRAKHLPLHEEVDRFEQEGYERQGASEGGIRRGRGRVADMRLR